MELQIRPNLIRIIILDISGIYSQIHNEGYFEEETVKEIQEQYSDTERLRVLVID